MKNECSIVRDILPLYVEDMVSADTSAFVEEHLEKCAECREEWKNLKKPGGFEPTATDIQNKDAEPLKVFKKKWTKRNRIMIATTVIATALIVLLGCCFIGTGFLKRNDVFLVDYSVSEDGTEITLHTGIASSMGYTRGFKDNGGGEKPHYLTFYATFGGLNSTFGAKREFELELDKTDTEIWFNRADGGYELVLQKNETTGEWVRPAK
ncbi:MAG: zf-HC2 domain-containing protein [Clostridia bacterium]|nr:zf-HC2 domain-containing protein [Clostridia bacterium]